MQIITFATVHFLLPTITAAATSASSRCVVDCQGNEPANIQVFRTSDATYPDIQQKKWRPVVLSRGWQSPSSATATHSPDINWGRPSTQLCGLGDCASAQLAKPFALAMQVSQPYALFAKKSSNYFLMQLPSPHWCAAIAVECAHIIHALLILAGDVEINPGPNIPENLLTELRKLTAGQNQLISEIHGLKSQLTSTDKAITDLSKRMNDLESHYQALLPIRNEVDAMRTTTEQAIFRISELEARIDDAENRSRRDNLIFYGIPDPSSSETTADSERLIVELCRDRLQLTIDPKEIERAHRIGRHSPNHSRPLIAKFTFHKTKVNILSSGRKLKGADYSISEDFSRSVRNSRKHLVAFAKGKGVPFSLRFKTLFIGSRRYTFDAASSSVKELS
ncbi:uncharacterized protein [Dermacentor andersoni]|uniref:uncharacterized protein n=1 Tax=Dermacentor andersoni TaxID=34620 RepID=UPI003B3A93D1